MGMTGMRSRALNFLSVLLFLGCGAAEIAQAQNLEAGKSPSKIFGQTCSACHRSPRGLLRSVPPGSLSGFLREHYTTSSNMAGLLADYLISNGAANTRYQTKGRRPEAARPEWEGAAPAYQPRRRGKRGKPNPDAAKEAPATAGPSADDRRGETNSGPNGEAAAARPDSASVTPTPSVVPQETVAPAGPPPSSD